MLAFFQDLGFRKKCKELLINNQKLKISYHAHLIEQPIPNLRIWIFTNFLTNVWFNCYCFLGQKQYDWSRHSGNFKIRSFKISCWIRWAIFNLGTYYTSSLQIFKRWRRPIPIVRISICFFGQSLFFLFKICKIFIGDLERKKGLRIIRKKIKTFP